MAVFSAIALIFALLIAFFYARGVTRPLLKLKQSVEELSLGNIDESVGLNRRDEIGMLSLAVDKMRLELLNKDIIRQSAIQYISHELKTPIMTIRCYANSIPDEIFPKGDLQGSIDVIDAQTVRLEGIVKKLIAVAKLDYLENKVSENEIVNLEDCVRDVCDRIFVFQNDLQHTIETETLFVSADKEQINVLIENLLENALRHAQNKVEIRLRSQADKAVLTLYNDGGPIDEAQLPVLFEPFKKGKNGSFGLGLSIVKRIADSYHMEIEAINTGDGVMFSVIFEKIDEITDR